MAETKFTPAPWEIYEEEYDATLGYQEPKIIANAANGALVHEIATIRIGLAATPFNARLISAAPDLLDACKELTTAILAIKVRLAAPRDKREQKAMDELYRLFAKGKAAIAKAEPK